MSEYNFVKYVKPVVLRARNGKFRPTVSGCLSANSRFIFNGVAVREFNLLDYKFCEVYYDADKKALGFLFVNADIAEDGTKNLKVCTDKRCGFVSLSANGIRKRFNIDLAKIKRRPIKVVGEMLVISCT